MPISIDCRQTLPDDCPTYFDRETRLLEAPMVIRVADQVSYISLCGCTENDSEGVFLWLLLLLLF